MKIKSLPLALLLLGVATGAQAVTTGNVHFTGKIVADTCTVAMDSKDKTVDLGVATATSLATVGSKSIAKPFQLNLESCTAGTSIALKWGGTTVASRTDLLQSTGTATRVGVTVTHTDGTPKVLRFGTGALDSESGPMTIAAGGGNHAFHFTAAMESHQANPAAGTVASTATFEIAYP